MVNPPDLLAVKLGNILARFSSSILELCRLHEIPATIENPAGSRLWILPPFLKLSKASLWNIITTHFCMFGKPWKKPTKFAGFHIDLGPAERRCHGRSECSRTARPHQGLQGTGPDGRMWTKIAEPYPARLCALLARCFEEAHALRWVHKIHCMGLPARPP